MKRSEVRLQRLKPHILDVRIITFNIKDQRIKSPHEARHEAGLRGAEAPYQGLCIASPKTLSLASAN
ncbi:hypothetical protein SBA7_490012 [Candidatus Sulfotelmatobacter sp. SbA7]|nr:hypothetical protein SBA7_490012 [Candidatus Sulfotelmatobacter sp. SbA7]